MPLMIAVLTLFAALTVADADAETDDERLAEMFSPILILTEDTEPPSDDSLSAQTEAGKRFAKKVIAGSLSSAIFSYILVDIQESGANLGRLGSLGGVLYGHLFGFPIGVSLVDPHDSFFGTLMGSILGEVGGVGLVYLCAATGAEVPDELLAFALLGGPAVGSLIASETWRKSFSAELKPKPQARRVSLGLAPIPTGGLSAVTTLHF